MAAVLLAAAVLTFYRLGAGTLWDQDETKYAEVAREILRTGDPVTLHANGHPWYVHPPLYMWLVAGTARITGFSTFTVRVWSGVFSIVAVYATVLLGQTLFNPRTGVLAGAALAVTFHFLVQSRLAVFDTVLVAFMLLAAYSAMRAYQTGRRADYLRFFMFAGFATLTKGPIGLILPVLVIAVFVTVRRAWSRWREVPWIPGVALYAVIGLSWYVAEAALHGAAFARPVLGYYGVGRFFGVVENQAGPWHYYVPIVVIGAFPWTAFWPAAAVWHWRRLRHDGSLFVVLWCLVVVVFYSLAKTKLPNYVLPVYPLAAVGIAAMWDAALQEPTPARLRAFGASAALLLLLVALLYAGIAHYLAKLYPSQFRAFSHILLPPAVFLAAGAAAAAGLLLASLRGIRGSTARSLRPPGSGTRPAPASPRAATAAAFVALCAAMALAWLGVIRWIVPRVEAEKPMPAVARAVAAAWHTGDSILGYRLDIYSSLIYYSGHYVEWISTPLELANAVCRPGRDLVVIRATERPRVALPKRLSEVFVNSGIDVLMKPPDLRCP